MTKEDDMIKTIAGVKICWEPGYTGDRKKWVSRWYHKIEAKLKKEGLEVDSCKQSAREAHKFAGKVWDWVHDESIMDAF